MMNKSALRNPIYSFVTLFVIASCQETSCSKGVDNKGDLGDSMDLNIQVNDKSNLDDFDQFILEFNTECDFQKKHIKFPLQSVANLDWETNNYDTSFITLKEYECIELTSPKSNIMLGLSTLKMTKTSNDVVVITFGIDDTGVNIEYYFQKKENNWQLIKIVDEST